MTDLYRVNPAVSFGWQAMGLDIRLSFVVQDPLSNCAAVLGRDEFWLPEFLNRMTGKLWASDQIIATAQPFCSSPTASVATLRRLWEIIFVNENTGSILDHGLATWQRFDCKLAFEFIAQSMDEGARLNCADPPTRCGDFASSGEIPLPVPAELPAAPLNSILYNRRTCREFNGRSIELPILSSLLYRALAGAPREVASGSALYQLIVLRADTLAPGVYAYTPASNSITQLRSCDASELESDLVQMLIGQTYVRKCACALLLWADTRALFVADPRPSALRRCLIYAGVIAQRLILLGSAHGLQTFLSAAIADQHARRIAGVHKGDWLAPMHCLAFGYKGP